MSKGTTRGSKPAEDLVKTRKPGSVELSESDLDTVAGGRKAGKDQQEFFKISDITIGGG